MLLSFIASVVGFVLLILNYSNGPALTNIGIVMMVVGVPTLVVSAFRRDRSNRNG